jgi:predicted CXXCH cytochrome family protein
LKRKHIVILIFLIIAASLILSAESLYAKQYPDCSKCHKIKFEGKTVHPIIKAAGCVACHTQPHEKEAKPRKFLFATGVDLCFACHDKEEFSHKVKHPPVAEGQCLFCHDVHISDYPKLLVASPPDLCFFCHEYIHPLPAVCARHAMHLTAVKQISSFWPWHLISVSTVMTRRNFPVRKKYTGRSEAVSALFVIIPMHRLRESSLLSSCPGSVTGVTAKVILKAGSQCIRRYRAVCAITVTSLISLTWQNCSQQKLLTSAIAVM